MKNTIAGVEKILFSLLYITACFTTSSDRLSGYFSKHDATYTYIRLVIIFVLIFAAVLLNKNNIKFINRFYPVVLNIAAVLFILDYYTAKISGTQMSDRIWWLVSIYTANAAMFIAVSLLKIENYKYFYKRFIVSITPIYIFTFIVCFFRSPFIIGRTVNTQLFDGTFRMFRAFINNPTNDAYLLVLFLGNLFIFIPLPVLLANYFNRIKDAHILITGFLMPICVEGYQYIFSCGNVDIDDLLLNWSGVIIGFILLKVNNKTRYINSE